MNYSETSLEPDAELLSVNTEIAATETIIEALSGGKTADEAVIKKTKLECRRFLLSNRKARFGALALFYKELYFYSVTVEIAEIDAFIDAVTTRKAAL